MMTIETLTAFFGWCAVIHIGIMALTASTLMLGGTWVARIHAQMFRLSEPELRTAYFQYLAQYKIAALTFGIIPYVALKLLATSLPVVQ